MVRYERKKCLFAKIIFLVIPFIRKLPDGDGNYIGDSHYKPWAFPSMGLKKAHPT